MDLDERPVAIDRPSLRTYKTACRITLLAISLAISFGCRIASYGACSKLNTAGDLKDVYLILAPSQSIASYKSMEDMVAPVPTKRMK